MVSPFYFMQNRRFMPCFPLFLQEYTIGLAGWQRHFLLIGWAGFEPKLTIFCSRVRRVIRVWRVITAKRPGILYPIKWTLGSVKWTGTSLIYGHP